MNNNKVKHNTAKIVDSDGNHWFVSTVTSHSNYWHVECEYEPEPKKILPDELFEI